MAFSKIKFTMESRYNVVRNFDSAYLDKLELTIKLC